MGDTINILMTIVNDQVLLSWEILISFLTHLFMSLIGSAVYILMDMRSQRKKYDKKGDGYDRRERQKYYKANREMLILILILSFVLAWKGENLFEAINEFYNWGLVFYEAYYFCPGVLFVMIQIAWGKFRPKNNET
jgi:di/tricarboxylate transporter